MMCDPDWSAVSRIAESADFKNDPDSCYRRSEKKGRCVTKQAFCPIRKQCKFGKREEPK